MARLRKLGKTGKYFAYFYDRARVPREKSYPLGTPMKSAAIKRLRSLEQRYLDPDDPFDPWVEAVEMPKAQTLAEATADFLRTRAHLRPASLKAYGSALRTLTGSLPPDITLKAVAPAHLQPLFDDQDIQPATRCYRYRHLKAFFSWAVEEGLIAKNPIDGVRAPREGHRMPEFLTPSQLEKLLGKIEGDFESKFEARQAREGEVLWLKDLVLLAVNTGMRLGELVSLRWSQVDLESRFVTVRNTRSFRTKSGNERAIPLSSEAVEVLRRLYKDGDGFVLTGKKGGPLNPLYASKRFKHYVREAKLPSYIRFHSLRHTCASWLVQRGVPLPIVQTILGHSSIQMTERYSHLAPDVMTQAIRQAFG